MPGDLDLPGEAAWLWARNIRFPLGARPIRILATGTCKAEIFGAAAPNKASGWGA
ncbi:hypothetical protein [Nannocystis pusilla]|uniref:hypothetical protein n=1 Tax=Nannocystis pusilla TaxID=889268 RepID=UPI003B8129B6